MTERKPLQSIVPILIGIAASGIYFWAARILLLDYPHKSAIKVLLFVLLPFFYWLAIRKSGFKPVLTRILPNRVQLPGLGLMLLAGTVLIVILNLIFIPMSGILGLEPVLEQVRTRNTIPYDTMVRRIFYIPIVNNFAEEFFFRIFLFGALVSLGFEKLGLIASAAIFSIYHFGIFEKWFDPLQMLAVLVLLFAMGLVLNLKARHDGHVAGVFLIHGLVNVAIMTVTLQIYS